MSRTISLWSTTAPYSEESPLQAQPTITEFAAENANGAVVVCPGGGYEMKAEHEGDPVAMVLQAAGISAYVLDYRVKPCNKFAPLTDALRAIRTVRSLGYAKVGILGFSAGGNLTCSAATLYNTEPATHDAIDALSARPDAFIPCYPVASLIDHTHIGSRIALLGEESGDHALAKLFSAEYNITPNTPPAFIWHTSNDSCVPVQNSLHLADALNRNGVLFELHIYPDGEHGLGLAQDREDIRAWSKDCIAWLKRLGF